MIPVRVASIAIDTRGQHVVLLKPIGEEPGQGKVLPIWIGAAESASILIAIEGSTPPRPLSHDLMRELLDAVGSEVTGVAVTRIEDGTYYAELTVRTPTGTTVIDCRPSDAIALASRLGAPLALADEVLEDAGVADDFTGEPDETPDASESPEDAEARVAEFREFLEHIDPEDFQG
ncbi:MAG: bifunctional nuclease family protein [Actinomycetales bacterium]|nr:bifunctional nuclease family protein [Actinomycetales bacterium]